MAWWVTYCVINAFKNRILEGKVGRTGRRGSRRKQLLVDLKEKRRYWNLTG
jgi:hypothetical protein